MHPYRRQQISPTVSRAQLVRAWDLICSGSSLLGAATAVGCLGRDLDLALWDMLGEDKDSGVIRRPEPQF